MADCKYLQSRKFSVYKPIASGVTFITSLPCTGGPTDHPRGTVLLSARQGPPATHPRLDSPFLEGALGGPKLLPTRGRARSTVDPTIPQLLRLPHGQGTQSLDSRRRPSSRCRACLIVLVFVRPLHTDTSLWLLPWASNMCGAPGVGSSGTLRAASDIFTAAVWRLVYPIRLVMFPAADTVGSRVLRLMGSKGFNRPLLAPIFLRLNLFPGS